MWGGDGKAHPSDPMGRIYNDCTTFCASWAAALTGVDPASALRGTYRTAEEAHAIVEAAGGHIAFMTSHLVPLGFSRVQNPVDGDIGCVVAPAGVEGDFAEIGAVRFGPLWVSLGPAGLVGKRLNTLVAWRFPA
ncbi:Hypothetical protein RG1141_CH01780 [Neorhizobium galegae bv. officinalis bv. officinalis str. HAMBI 1141]|uniref:DUF6950 domain-containing protein n=2 Tax=Neorhizobium galegae TaxID=399 RepID=A0A068T2C0_NEOGA|nr:Hypothetical protein RG1141_CH01780 [Neorhizobium galegae bv. officinalis bv. officinalis str. HAMBI 1141]